MLGDQIEEGNELTIFLTIDLDWSPDFATDWLLEELRARGIEATVFTTHYTRALEDHRDFFEIGLHPDFSRLSFQEACIRATSLREHYPESQGMRSHRNVFGQHIAAWAREIGLSYDVSTLLWKKPSPYFLDQAGLLRLSYSWEDGIELDYGWRPEALSIPRYRGFPLIVNCHPVLMYLNAQSDSVRRSALQKVTDLTSISVKDLQGYRNEGHGIASRLFEYLESQLDGGATFSSLGSLTRQVLDGAKC